MQSMSEQEFSSRRRNQILHLANYWLSLDKDPGTRHEILILYDKKDYAELDKRLSTRISFGTAGLRARMQAGFSRMNSLIVIQASQGLAEYLVGADPASCRFGVVIGYDTRNNSFGFAKLAAAAFAAKGFKIYLFDEYVHTPLVPFAVNFLKAAAGIMITASHNPAYDNGYKVYASNGCQIKSPMDKHIARSIEQNLEPIEWELTPNLQVKLVHKPLSFAKDSYFEQIRSTIDTTLSIEKFPRFAYTAMHGVGLTYMMEAMRQLQILPQGTQNVDNVFATTMIVVEEQSQPDPDFPTVLFPNPEEEGALNIAMQTAERAGAKLILATDPDADRFAAAEHVNGQWYQFTGDQMGILLAAYLLQTRLTKDSFTMLTSAVSSQMLAAIGTAEDFRVEECMTGFKWLGNRALDLGNECIYAYEEALGYMFPNVGYDKDGVAAAVYFVQACATWGSPWQELQRLYAKYGYFETKNTYWKSPDVGTTKAVFAKIRGLGKPYPAEVGGRKVVGWRDLTRPGFDSSTEGNVPQLPVSSSQMITCWLDHGTDDQGIRFTARASGTEPKIKVYVECRATKAEAAQSGAMQILRYLDANWFNDAKLKMEEKFKLAG